MLKMGLVKCAQWKGTVQVTFEQCWGKGHCPSRSHSQKSMYNLILQKLSNYAAQWN